MRKQYGFSAADDHERHCRQPHHPCLQRSRRVATDGGEDMSNELAEMLENPAYWAEHFGTTFFTFFEHHNCNGFPRVYYSGAPQGIKYTSEINRFSTDDVLPGSAAFRPAGVSFAYWPTQRQIELVDYAGGLDVFGEPGGAACDSEGRLFTWGVTNASGRGMNGHGPPLRQDAFLSRIARSPRQVFGEGGELADVRFVKCGVSDNNTSALSSDGVIYISGGAASGYLGDGAWSEGMSLQETQSLARLYHKPLVGYSWKTYTHGFQIAAIDHSGDLYRWGPLSGFSGVYGFSSPQKLASDFVDEITIVHPGSGTWSFPTVSSPQLPDGEPLRFDAAPRTGGGGSITDVWIINPGRGYTSPPVISFAGDDPPILSCSLFSSKWSQCFSDLYEGGLALISDQGFLYTLSGPTLEQYNHPGGVSFQATRQPKKYIERKVKKVALGGSHGIFIDENDELYGWGRQDFVYNPEGTIFGFERNKAFKLLEGKFIDVAANRYTAMAVREDGVIFAAGLNQNGALAVGDFLKRVTMTQAAGNIRAKRVFRGAGDSFVALRDQTYDAAGNPVYPE